MTKVINIGIAANIITDLYVESNAVAHEYTAVIYRSPDDSGHRISATGYMEDGKLAFKFNGKTTTTGGTTIYGTDNLLPGYCILEIYDNSKEHMYYKEGLIEVRQTSL